MKKLNSEEKAKKLGTAKLVPLIISLSIPAICGNLTIALYNIISRIYVGNYVGSDALGAIGVVFPFTNITAAISVMITIGGGTLVSLNLGRQEKEKTNHIFTNIVFASVLAGIMLAFTYYFGASPFMTLNGVDSQSSLFGMSVLYLKISAFGQLFHIVNLSLAAVIRAEGNTKYAMFVSMVGAGINLALVSIFIPVFHWGLQGAAIATVISQITGALFSILYFVRKKSISRWKSFHEFSIKSIFTIVSMGIAPAILQGLSFFTNLLINHSLIYHASIEVGTQGAELAVSAVSVISTVESVAIMIILGLNNGISAIISYNYGMKQYDRVRKTSLIGQVMGLGISLVVWFVLMFFPEQVFRVFANNNTELIAYGVMAVRKSKMFLLFLGFQTLASMYYSAIGKPGMATLISISRNGLFLIPALLLLPLKFGLEGVLYSTSLSDFCSMLVVSALYWLGINHKFNNKKEKSHTKGRFYYYY